MAGSLIQTFKNRSVALTHVCSACGNPVVHYSTLHSLVFLAHNDTLKSRVDKHKQRASEVAEAMIDQMVRQINGCREKPLALGALEQAPKQSAWSGVEMRTQIDDKTKGTAWVSGLTGPCPYCGFQEPWQKPARTKALKEAKPESFPTVFDSADRADLWAVMYMQRQMEADAELRRDPDRLAQTRDRLAGLLETRNEAQAELDSTARQDQIAALQAQKEQLDRELKAAGMMAFKLKKELNAKIQEVTGQIQALQTEDKQQKEALRQQVRLCELAAQRLDVTLSGGQTAVEAYVSDEAKALRLVAAE